MRRLAASIALATALLAAPASAQISCVTALSMLAATPSSTVAALPTCTAGLSGTIYLVTNALTPAVGTLVIGGGAVQTLVHCNGTIYVVG